MTELTRSDLSVPTLEHRAARLANSLDDIVILGGGLASLFAALKLSPRPVTIVTAGPIGRGAADAWIEGGVHVALERALSPERLLAETLAAGCGLALPAMASLMAREAPGRIADLERLGVPVRDDALTGAAIMATLADAVRCTPSIRVIEGFVGESLILEGKTVRGIQARGVHGLAIGTVAFPAHAVVLASGGIGQLYTDTINPLEAQGQGLGMAARAGAILADGEFVAFRPASGATEQFHMGGVLTDARGRTSLDGLWAIGEVAATGVHGAGFIEVNALLEALVFSARAAADIQALMPAHRTNRWSPRADEASLDLTLAPETDTVAEARRLMTAAAGPERDADGLADALVRLTDLARRARHANVRALLAAARLVVAAAWRRPHSIGAHRRRDGELVAPSLATRQYLTLSDCDRAADEANALISARPRWAVA